MPVGVARPLSQVLRGAWLRVRELARSPPAVASPEGSGDVGRQPVKRGARTTAGAIAGEAWTSTAPMSQPAPLGRPSARWSTRGLMVDAPSAEQADVATPSISGLPACGSRVSVGPPLSASGPRRGLPPLFVSVESVKPQVLSSLKL
jgi:hypothetical protein